VATTKTKRKRQDTRLEAEGAEFLVLGNLLVEGIDAYKSYRYMAGYDLVAVLPDANSTARIQVKSRWASDATTYLIKRFDCDFVVFVKLNRGNRYKNNADPKKWSVGRAAPVMYVFPTELVKKNRVPGSTWGRVILNRIPNFETYKERWDLIRGHRVKNKRQHE
jgi:hypothetical protein